MSLIKAHQWEDIEFFELGYSWYGKPMITVYSYYLKGILIDTGPSNLQKSVVKLFENRPLDKILLTHYHEDHSGNAETLRQTYQTTLLAGEMTCEKVQNQIALKPYQIYSFGRVPKVKNTQTIPQLIENEHFTLTPLFTPGHSADHYGYLEKDRGWFFSGDLYLGLIKMMRPEENIGQMIRSIKMVLTYDFEVLFCAHNPKFKKGKSHLQKKLQHLEDFYGKVKELHHKGLKIKEIIKVLGLKENYRGKIWTFNDIGLDFMIKSVIEN
jgi:glyoxylase-like metal-dependent hydrolase (beta-lactamase superfamily II)